MSVNKSFDRRHWSWISVLLLHVLVIAAFLAWPATLPASESQEILSQAAPFDVIIIYDPGGWGNSTLEESTDFAPVLLHIQDTLLGWGYTSLLVVYDRSASGFSGQIADIKGLFNDFRDAARVQAADISFLKKSYPQKSILLTGFSNGGALAGRTLTGLQGIAGVYSIVAGVAGRFPSVASPTSLVLNNNGRDTLSTSFPLSFSIGALESPFRLFWAKVHGRSMALGLSLQFSGHEYQWSSPEVGTPIVDFLARNFQK